jgi:hypothetical protein
VDDDEGGRDDELFMIADGRGGGDRATLRVDCPGGGADKVSAGDPERGWAKASKTLGAGDKPLVEEPTCRAVVLPSDGIREGFPGGGGGRLVRSSVGVVAPK